MFLNKIRVLSRPLIYNHYHNGIILATRVPVYKQSQLQFSARTGQKQTPGAPVWRSIVIRFVPIGICLIAVMQWRAYRKQNRDQVASQFQISCYCGLPLRTLSRWWGYIADVEIPSPLRPALYKTYIKAFGVNIEEAVNQDLKSYASISNFFVREIRSEVRPIDTKCGLVSPCDGTVLHVGPAHMGRVEQVKGVTYTLEDFFGDITWKKCDNCDYYKKLMHKPTENRLYQCVIYLAPGDYHRFHSPVEWTPTYRRHFAGQLLSVNPQIVRWLPGLFCMNERAVYVGEWASGFFSYTLIGATNVGSIRVNFDPTLRTNCAGAPAKQCCDLSLTPEPISLRRGDPLGEFRMGSTVVLIFEAPATFTLGVSAGDKVNMGQAIGHYQCKQIDSRNREE